MAKMKPVITYYRVDKPMILPSGESKVPGQLLSLKDAKAMKHIDMTPCDQIGNPIKKSLIGKLKAEDVGNVSEVVEDLPPRVDELGKELVKENASSEVAEFNKAKRFEESLKEDLKGAAVAEEKVEEKPKKKRKPRKKKAEKEAEAQAKDDSKISKEESADAGKPKKEPVVEKIDEPKKDAPKEDAPQKEYAPF